MDGVLCAGPCAVLSSITANHKRRKAAGLGGCLWPPGRRHLPNSPEGMCGSSTLRTAPCGIPCMARSVTSHGACMHSMRYQCCSSAAARPSGLWRYRGTVLCRHRLQCALRLVSWAAVWWRSVLRESSSRFLRVCRLWRGLPVHMLLVPLQVGVGQKLSESWEHIRAYCKPPYPCPCPYPSPSSAAVTGLLTLHTVPTRETFALVKTLQVGGKGSVPSIAAVLGSEGSVRCPGRLCCNHCNGPACCACVA